jgi:hypothetical protein
VNCSLCPGGRFGSTKGLTSPSCTGACSAGYVCPPGSTSSTAAGCPVGTFSGAGAAECTACPASVPYSIRASPSVSACVSCSSGCENGLFGVYGANGPVGCIGIAASWSLWVDSSSVEGGHCCVKFFPTAVTWAVANASCIELGPGAHLVTALQVRLKLHP